MPTPLTDAELLTYIGVRLERVSMRRVVGTL